jgi:hypothetical protein
MLQMLHTKGPGPCSILHGVEFYDYVKASAFGKNRPAAAEYKRESLKRGAILLELLLL